LPLIPKAQDAMTSVVYLYIVSATSTGEPVNSPWWNNHYIFSYHTHLHSADVICFVVVSLNVGCLSRNLTLIRCNYVLSFLIVPNFKFFSVFNKKICWTSKCQSLWNKMSLTFTSISPVCQYSEIGRASCRERVWIRV
jgi:hypothetical protein